MSDCDTFDRTHPIGSAAARRLSMLAAPRQGLFRRGLLTHTFHVAQLASVPTVVGLMVVSNGSAMFHQIASAIAAPNAMGVIAVGVAVTYALTVTQTVSGMKEDQRAAEHDKKSMQKMEDLHGEITVTKRDIGALTDYLDQLARQVSAFHASDRRSIVTRENTSSVWENIAANSVFYSVGGQCRRDVVSERRSDGSARLVVDTRRMMNWVRRYGPHGVARAHIVLFCDDDAGTVPTHVAPQIAFHLAAFRGVVKIAARWQIALRLDRVRFYICHRSEAKNLRSFLLGEYALGGINVPFVNSYTDFAAMYNVPKTLLDDDVETNYALDAFEKYRHLAEVLMGACSSYSLMDLETRYGHLVPDPECDLSDIGSPPWVQPSGNLADSYDIVASSDHFAIRRR